MAARRTWKAHFKYHGARYLPTPMAFWLICQLERDGGRRVEVELTREEAFKLRQGLDRFLHDAQFGGRRCRVLVGAARDEHVFAPGVAGCQCGERTESGVR